LIASRSSQTPQQALAALLEQHTPACLLHVGYSDLPAIDAFSRSHPDSVIDRAQTAPLSDDLASRRYDLALIADCLEHLPKQDGLQLLGGIRNLNASRIAVLVDLQACDWQATDFYALALQVSTRFERNEQTLTLFTYDLLEYKQVPDWLNAKFWANPQMFGKYWW
jgi:DNA-binding transcriptional LysR family regulator